MRRAVPRGLRWVSDREPGLQRIRRGSGFAYRDARGRAVCEAATLQRIRGLAIPPPYRDVRTCARADGHLQASRSSVLTGVAHALGNMPAVCRKSYVHPAVLDALEAGSAPAGTASHAGPRAAERLLRLLRSLARARRDNNAPCSRRLRGTIRYPGKPPGNRRTA